MKPRRFNKDKSLSKLGNRNNKNIKIASIVCSVVLLVGAIIYFSFARFESNNTYSLINGVVVQSAKDINIVAVYQGETKTDTIPAKGSGWAFKNVTCDNGTAEWDYSTWSLVVNTTTKTKCTLYFVQPSQTAVEYINSLTDSSLVSDETTDNNKRYIGSNPNNYVRFNNELWRILGVMNNIETSSGQTQSLLKIRRADPLGNYSWDTSASTINNESGINQWGASDGYEGADLMRELNTDYLGNTYEGIDGKWYNGSNDRKTANMPTSTINQSSQDMIETVIWNLGSPSNNNGTYDSSWISNITPSTSYTRERASTNGKICTSGNYCNDTVTRTSTWTGKVGLLYPSDYGYSTIGGTTTPRATCLNTSMNSWESYSDCYNNSWIYNSTLFQWTLSPRAYSSSADYVFSVSSSGHVHFNNASNANAVSPVVFLKSAISITGGDGTSNDPYTLG